MGRLGGRLTKLLLLATAALAVTASSGTAASRAHGRMLGVIRHGGAPHALPRPAGLSTAAFLTFDANYESLINRYFADVAHDSGGTANVYSVATQYTDGAGALQYQSNFAGSYVSNDPLPANGCDDGVDSVCLTDQQLQDEIQHVLTVEGWHGSTSNMFILMTPNGVGSCFDSFSNQCTTNVFCAYHSDFTNSSGERVIYANEPYNATITGCDPESSPNSDDADAELNTISHEHNEAITDPFGDGWWRDSDGQENGDLCAWDFGTALGGSAGTRYNQIINGGHYWLQREWSNNGSNCFQNSAQESGPTHAGQNLDYHGGLVMHTNTVYAIYWLPTLGNTGLPAVTGTAAVNHTLTSSNGTWSGTPTGYAYQWQRCSSAATACVNIAGATGPTYTATTDDGGYTLRSTVAAQNVNGFSPYAASAASQIVAPLPIATAAPVVSGRAGVGRTVATTNGTWNTPAAFAYQWLRCAADGTHCAAIAGATAATHIAVAADVGRRLEARVSATNAVGTGVALSRLSGIVVAVPRSKKAPRVSGYARTGGRLSASKGLWTGPPSSYRYQWLRCSERGGSCLRIRHATHSTYRVGRPDAGDRLRVRVTATNAAGSRTATSVPTKRVLR
jgi:hypothetical protein